MTPELARQLAAQDITTEDPLALTVALRGGEGGEVLPLEGASVPVAHGRQVVAVELPPLSQLLTGRGVAPDLSREPTPELLPVFLCIERVAALYCTRLPRPVHDRELERLYGLLRRRPDGADAHPLFGYLQAAARLSASLRELSPQELEAVFRRLEKSARRWHSHAGSTNYFERALRDFV